MTFDEIVSDIMDQLDQTSPDAVTRIGKLVNIEYRKLTSSLGIETSRFITGHPAVTTPGLQTVTFTGIESIERIINDTDGTIKTLDPKTFAQIREVNPRSADDVKAWALESNGPSTVVVRLDVVPQNAFTLKADGISTAATLSGSQTPNFSQDFHDILIEAVLSKELRKSEKPQLARIASDNYDKRMGEFRLWLALNPLPKMRQAGQTADALANLVGGGGGSAPSGGISYTQTGEVRYDRGPGVAPFTVVQPTAAVVTNLDADKVDGLHAADLIRVAPLRSWLLFKSL